MRSATTADFSVDTGFGSISSPPEYSVPPPYYCSTTQFETISGKSAIFQFASETRNATPRPPFSFAIYSRYDPDCRGWPIISPSEYGIVTI
jgi:hypothetical protein